MKQKNHQSHQRKKSKRKKPIIALAQIRYFDIYRKNNVEKIKRYIRMAKKANADIICFPESCIHKTETLYFNDTLIREIREECKKNEIWCIITEDLEIRGKRYNVSMLIDRKGEIKGGYRKIHLYGDEVNPGRKIRVFKTDFAKIGIVICWDLAFPELFKRYKDAGAQIVFCPAQWWYDTKAHDEKHEQREMKILESLVIARAFENVYFVALCNPVMESKYQISYSAIASPTKILKKIIGKQGMIISQISLNEIEKAQKIYDS
ncbi:MAG: carbon-nitrogen hydrolase family protein [Nanoarchaeota archaeon]|nr:carbon-nitrogen hydrolase family protein [Nanoarchaeota archaeon]